MESPTPGMNRTTAFFLEGDFVFVLCTNWDRRNRRFCAHTNRHRQPLREERTCAFRCRKCGIEMAVQWTAEDGIFAVIAGA